MPKRDLLTIELLHKLLICDPIAGKLWWRERPVELFKSTRDANAWNTRFSGKEAFTASLNNYLCGRILGKTYLAHRVIFAMEAGFWPTEVDHEDQNGSNNRFENLRDGTHQDNMKNQPIPLSNTSGILGVCWEKSRNKWRADIAVDGKPVHLGRFNCLTAAAIARQAANTKYGYHPNHGAKP